MERSKRMGSPREPVTTKITGDLRLLLNTAAEANSRTVGAEIEHRLRESFAAQSDLRAIIREEIRAALGIVGPFSDPKEFTASLRQAVADLPDEERRLYGPRPELVRNNANLGGIASNYGQTYADLQSQTYDRSALNGKQ